MKKILIALALIISFSTPSHAEDMIRLTVTGTNVNLRAGSGKSSPVVGRADRPDVFIAQDWASVNAKEDSVWYRLVYYIDKSGNLYDVRQRTKNNDFPYISAKFVRASDLKASDSAKISELKKRTGPENMPAPRHKTVHVSDAKSFLAALKSNTTVILTPGTFNLSEWAPPAPKELNEQALAKHKSPEQMPKLNDGVYWSDVFDGSQLMLRGIHNLTIQGTVKNETKEITDVTVDPRYAFVMSFTNCSGISIENITAGHTEAGECSGGVFEFTECANIKLNGADMYGCGTEGLRLTLTKDVTVSHSSIYDCTYDIMTLDSCRNITFNDDCSFYGNKEYTLVNVWGSDNVTYTNCDFSNNKGSQMFDVDGASKVTVDSCHFMGNSMSDGPVKESKNVTFKNCKFN